MRKLSLMALATMLLLSSVKGMAAEAKVNFDGVEDYTDFEPASGIEERFQKQRMDELTGYFGELAGQLPEGQVLSINVTDIDLTGRLEPTFGQSASFYIRVVRRVDFPTMDFSYQLSDANGSVIKEGDVNLKDMSFDFDTMATKHSRNDALYYEKKMLRDWFTSTFADVINPPA